MKWFYVIAIGFVSSIIISCNGTTVDLETNKVAGVFQQGDSLIVEWDDGKSQLLTDESRYYDFILSPDSLSVAVNLSPVTGIYASKVFYRDSTDAIQYANISSIGWARVKVEWGLDPESLNYPKSRIISWSDSSNTVLIELNGEYENDSTFNKQLKIVVPRR